MSKMKAAQRELSAAFSIEREERAIDMNPVGSLSEQSVIEACSPVLKL